MKIKNTILVILICFPNLVSAAAGTSYSAGGTTFYNFSDGTSATASNAGGITFYNFSDGVSGTASNVGNITFYHFNSYNLDNELQKQNISITPSQKINLFTEADQKKDSEVYSLLNYYTNEQCKIHTAKQYDSYKIVNKNMALLLLQQKLVQQSASQTIEQCQKDLGGTGTIDPLIAGMCLSYYKSNNTDYVKSINYTYQLSINKFNPITTYEQCDKAMCSEGYLYKNNRCITYTEDCQLEFGLNTYGTKGNANNSTCYCVTGYQWNSIKTECIKSLSQASNQATTSESQKIIAEEKALLTPINNALSDRLSGYILLQVERKGEAWYVNPNDEKKYYLGRPEDAFRIMRELGLGVSNKDFNFFNGKAPNGLSGKILLKVEDSGKAYYVNPVDLKMYYLGRPADAFKVMREKGLGISNTDIRKIAIQD